MMTAQQFTAASPGKSKSGSKSRRNSKYRRDKSTAYVDAPMDAPWKIENILENGAPKKEDWWQSTKTSMIVEGDTDAVTDDKESDTSSSEVVSSFKDSNILESNDDNNMMTNETTFQNVGRKNWEQARQEWRKATVANRPPPPPPVRYDEVVRGLLQVQRTYELPGPMTLPDIISVFRDIWDCENDF